MFRHVHQTGLRLETKVKLFDALGKSLRTESGASTSLNCSTKLLSVLARVLKVTSSLCDGSTQTKFEPLIGRLVQLWKLVRNMSDIKDFIKRIRAAQGSRESVPWTVSTYKHRQTEQASDGVLDGPERLFGFGRMNPVIVWGTELWRIANIVAIRILVLILVITVDWAIRLFT